MQSINVLPHYLKITTGALSTFGRHPKDFASLSTSTQSVFKVFLQLTRYINYLPTYLHTHLPTYKHRLNKIIKPYSRLSTVHR